MLYMMMYPSCHTVRIQGHLDGFVGKGSTSSVGGHGSNPFELHHVSVAEREWSSGGHPVRRMAL